MRVLCQMNCPEHAVGATKAYRSRGNAFYLVCRRDTKTADILMPNGVTCLGTFHDNYVWRDPVPFSTGKSGITLRSCSPTLHTPAATLLTE